MLYLDVVGPFIWLLVTLLPGALAGLVLFKKEDLIEKLILGSFSSFAFLLAAGALLTVLSIPFSYLIVLSLIVLEYLIALALLVHHHIKGELEVKLKVEWPHLLGIVALLILLYISFIVRFTTVTPIYYELDPYFYLYISGMLLSPGHVVPAQDTTAWWPVLNTTHRTVPGLAFYQAAFFALNTGRDLLSGYNDFYRLSFLANYYPPLAGLFLTFMFYLLLKHRFKDVWFALLGAFLLQSTPLITTKMFSGVFEAQPLSLLWHVAFLATMYLAFKEKDDAYKWLAALTAFVYPLATTQAIIGMFLLALYALYSFIKRDDTSLKTTLYASITFFIGYFLYVVWQPNGILSKGVWITYLLPSLIFASVAYLLKNKFAEVKGLYTKHRRAVLTTSVVLFLFVFWAGWNIFVGGVKTGEYAFPLQRTIAEQQPLGRSVQSQLGFVGLDFYHIVKGSDGNAKIVEAFPLSSFFAILAAPFQSIYSFIILVLGKFAVVVFNPKIPSLLFYVWGAAFAYFFWEGWRFFFKKEELDHVGLIISLLFLSISIPGLLKAKYLVQLALSAGLAGGYFIAYGLDLIKKKYDIVFAYVITAILFVLILDVNFYGHLLDVPFLYYASAMKPAYMPSALNSTFSPFCSINTSQNITVGQYCAMHSASWCSLFPSQTPLPQLKGSFNELCHYAGNLSVVEQYSSNLCQLYFIVTAGHALSSAEQTGISFACGTTLPKQWMDSMAFIYSDTPKDARITSWWDYGHWINYWGRRNAVIRNEHRSHYMIGEVAYAYLMANLSDFNSITSKFGSNYSLFDREILFSGNAFGGKYYALNYLACADRNLTSVDKAQLESQCEKDNLWESIYVTDEECTVSPLTGKKGKIAYAFRGNDPRLTGAKKKYCFADVKTLYGPVKGIYELDNKNAMGELVLHRALPKPVGSGLYNLYYVKDPIWYVNGSYVEGWEDHESRFYDSPLYQAFILNDLPGWSKVYDNQYVKIYKRG